jgi:hypothetical protein
VRGLVDPLVGVSSPRARTNTGGLDRVRTAELIGALSLATDLGIGLPLEYGLHSTLIAMRLGERLGIDPGKRSGSATLKRTGAVRPLRAISSLWLRQGSRATSALSKHSRASGARASPAAVKAINSMQLEVDACAVLRSIHVPTLVMNRTDDRIDPITEARFIADAIPGARLVELPGGEHPPFLGDTERVVEELHRLITSIRTEEAVLERVLATVLFTDIVGSADRAAALGDRAWSDVLERHHALVRAMLARYRGVEVDTAGDGFFATFDGPARAATCARAIVEGVKPLGIEAALACTRVRLRRPPATPVGWRSSSGRGSERLPKRRKYWRLRQSRTSPRDRASPSRTRASMS